MAEPDKRHSDDEMLGRLDRSTNEVLEELQQVRAALNRRPTRVESKVRSRMLVLALAFGIFFAMQLHDIHVEHCSPGAASANGIAYFADTPEEEFSRERLQEEFRTPTRASCEFTFPTHAHDDGEWPTTMNVMGMAFYVTLLGAGITWWRMPIWRRGQDEDEAEELIRHRDDR